MSRWDILWNNWNPNWIAVDYKPEWVKAVKFEGDKMRDALVLTREYVLGIPSPEATRKILKLINELFDDLEDGVKE